MPALIPENRLCSPALEIEETPYLKLPGMSQCWNIPDGRFIELIYNLTYKVKQSTWQAENGWLGSHSTFDQEKKENVCRMFFGKITKVNKEKVF